MFAGLVGSCTGAVVGSIFGFVSSWQLCKLFGIDSERDHIKICNPSNFIVLGSVLVTTTAGIIFGGYAGYRLV